MIEVTVMTVAADDECFACQKFASEGYGEWYEVGVPQVGYVPTQNVPAVPEPSPVALMVVGSLLFASRLWFLRRKDRLATRAKRNAAGSVRRL